MKANNPKNNKNFNKAVYWLTQHNTFNDQRTLLEDTSEAEYVEDTTAWKRINRKCEETFDVYLMYCEEIPKADIKTIEKELW